MNIPPVTKDKAMPKTAQETNMNVKDAKSEGVDKGSTKNRVDSSDISSIHTNMFEDKRLSSFKAALLSEMSSDHLSRQAEEVREQVEQGRYQVSDEELANALIDVE